MNKPILLVSVIISDITMVSLHHSYYILSYMCCNELIVHCYSYCAYFCSMHVDCYGSMIALYTMCPFKQYVLAADALHIMWNSWCSNTKYETQMILQILKRHSIPNPMGKLGVYIMHFFKEWLRYFRTTLYHICSIAVKNLCSISMA